MLENNKILDNAKIRLGHEVTITLNVFSYTRSAEKFLARPTSRCFLFDGENISFDASLILYIYIYICIYRVSQEECSRLREGVPYVKIYRFNPKHLCPKLNGYGDNGQRSLKL